uniref:Olfactomedin-like domain-containing protein n=1 Tax=Amphimedon queenslandica TaxID=400682 RepID=A0A1X7U5W9_AMPQE
MSLITFCVMLLSAIVVFSIAAPVNEPEEVISIEYNDTKNESNISKQEPSLLNYIRNLEKRIYETEKEVIRLNELITQHHDETTKNVYRITVNPRPFTEWVSLPLQHTSSIDTFDVNETRYMIITSDFSEMDTKIVSVYKITREGPTHVHNITLPGARTTKSLNINNKVYTAIACENPHNDKNDVHIYTWTDDETLKLLQTFDGARDPTFGRTTSHSIYLALTKNDGEWSTKVYKWDHKDNRFHSIQFQEAIRGAKPNFFLLKNHLWLSTSNKFSSIIYRWNELRSRFQVYQRIPLPSLEAMDLQPMPIESHYFLVATSLEGPSLLLYKWSSFRERFEIFQNIPAFKIKALDSFNINNYGHFIAMVKASDTSAGTKELVFYKFSGAATNDLFQSITADDPSSVKVFHHHHRSILAIGNALSLDLFKLNDA